MRRWDSELCATNYAETLSQVTLCTHVQVGPTALARLEISGIQFNLTSDPQTLQMDTPYSGKFYAGITNGSVLVSTNLAGGANKPASLIGATGNSSATIIISPQVPPLPLLLISVHGVVVGDLVCMLLFAHFCDQSAR